MYYSPIELIAMAYNLSSQQIELLVRLCKSNLRVLTLLAARPDLDPVNAAILSEYPDVAVRRRALTKVTDAVILQKYASSQVYSVSVANNTNAPAGILDDLLRNGTHNAQIRAACNPSTPQESRKEVLADEKLVEKLVYVGTPIGLRVMRSHDLVNNNTWLLDDLSFDRYDLNIKRAIIGNYKTSQDTIAHAVKTMRSPNMWTSLARHPYRKGLDFASQSLADLVQVGSASTDLYLLEHPMLDLHTARMILNSRGLHRLHPLGGFDRDVYPEPHIVALLAKRFGVRCFEGFVPYNLAVTRVTSAAWKEPCVYDYVNACIADYRPLEEVANALGMDTVLWNTFISLGKEWQGSLTDLAKVCTKL